MNFLDHALAYAAKGWPVFPCVPNGKEPITLDGFKSATTDPAKIRGWWKSRPDANIATSPGLSSHMVTDTDPGHDKAELDRAYGGTMPDTKLVTLTPRGGEHFWHTLAPDERVAPSASKVAPNVDIRSTGSYVLLPPSVTPDGRYEWKHETENWPPPPFPKAAYRSDAMVAAAGTAKPKQAAADREMPATKMLNDPHSVARFTAWLQADAAVSISGRGGNNVLAKTGAMGSSYGLSEDETLHLMAEHWNARCVPPWDPEDIEKYGGSGYRSSTSAFGNMARHHPELIGFKDERPRGTASSSGGEFRTMADIPGPAPPRQWAIGDNSNGWVPLSGLTSIYGDGGVGKSTLAPQIARDVSRGDKIFGLLPTRKMPAVWVECEDPEEEMHRKLEKQGRRMDDQVTFISMAGKDASLYRSTRQKDAEETTPFYRKLDHHLASLPAGPKMLLITNLSGIYLGNYYEPAEIMACQTVLYGLAEKHEATVIIFAHPSENQKNSGAGGGFGVQWNNGVRARIFMERHMTPAFPSRGGRPAVKAKLIGRERIFSRKKSNYADDGDHGIVLDWVDGAFVPVKRAEKPAPFTPVGQAEPKAETAVDEVVEKAVLEILASNPSKAWSGRGLAADATHLLGSRGHEGITMDKVRSTHMKRMIEKGSPAYCRVDGKGQWRHTSVN